MKSQHRRATQFMGISRLVPYLLSSVLEHCVPQESCGQPERMIYAPLTMVKFSSAWDIYPPLYCYIVYVMAHLRADCVIEREP